jgi:hemerythrin
MKIESEKLEIIKAFRDYSYVIPDYQREYIWKEKNVEQLLSDVYDEYMDGRDSEYFIGSIVVTKRDGGAFEVMDGQQRLTTLFLSLCALKRLLKNSPQHLSEVSSLLASQVSNERGEFSQSRHLDLQYKDSSEILDIILNEKDLDNKLTGSSRNIKEAFEAIHSYLKSNFQKQEDLVKFYGYFMHRVIFVQIVTPSVSDALKIFETINERGVGLDPMDLLKNLIFRQLEKRDFQRINMEWKSITKTLDKNNQKALRFLRYFIMANYPVRDTRDNEVIREDEIYNWIVKHADQCGYKNDPFGFVKRIQEGAEAYTSFFRGVTLNGEKSTELENIRSLGGGAFSQHLVMLLAAKDLPNELFLYLVRQIESLIFYYFITKTPAKALEARFSKWADDLRGVVKNIDQKTALNEFIERTFIVEKKRLENDFKAMFTNLTINSLQRYKIKYILAKIAQYVESKRIGGEGAGNLERYIDKKIEIEHILPNTPTNELVVPFGDMENYNNYKIKLGNLTLLEKPHNVVAGRGYFEKKKNIYKQSTFYITKSIAQKDNVGNNTAVTRINEKLIEFDKWEANDIGKRQEMLLALSKDVWDIKIL